MDYVFLLQLASLLLLSFLTSTVASFCCITNTPKPVSFTRLFFSFLPFSSSAALNGIAGAAGKQMYCNHLNPAAAYLLRSQQMLSTKS